MLYVKITQQINWLSKNAGIPYVSFLMTVPSQIVQSELWILQDPSESNLIGTFILKRNPSGLILNLFVPSFSIILKTIVPLYLKDDFHFAYKDIVI